MLIQQMYKIKIYNPIADLPRVHPGVYVVRCVLKYFLKIGIGLNSFCELKARSYNPKHVRVPSLIMRNLRSKNSS